MLSLPLIVAVTTLLLLPLGSHTAMPLASADSQAAIPHAYFLDFLDYTFTLDSAQIFPNDTIKNDVLNNQTRVQYNISSLEHELMGHHINATDVKVNVTPSTIDENRMRLDLEIFAQHVNVTGASSRYYDRVDLESLYGIYDSRTDQIEVHIPMGVALSYLGKIS